MPALGKLLGAFIFQLGLFNRYIQSPYFNINIEMSVRRGLLCDVLKALCFRIFFILLCCLRICVADLGLLHELLHPGSLQKDPRLTLYKVRLVFLER